MYMYMCVHFCRVYSVEYDITLYNYMYMYMHVSLVPVYAYR